MSALLLFFLSQCCAYSRSSDNLDAIILANLELTSLRLGSFKDVTHDVKPADRWRARSTRAAIVGVEDALAARSNGEVSLAFS